MRGALRGRLLIAAGGLAILLGSFWPEATRAAHNALHPESRLAAPERSHWVVIREDLDMLADPDPDLDPWVYDFYAAEAAGLAYVAVAGVLALAAAALPTGRAVAALLFLAHVACHAAVAWLAGRVALGAPAGSGAGEGLRMGVAWAAAGLGALALGEAAFAARTLARRVGRRLAPADAAQALPMAFLLAAGAVLYLVLRQRPHWPAGGYPVIAAGAALALLGAWARRPAPGRPGDAGDSLRAAR